MGENPYREHYAYYVLDVAMAVCLNAASGSFSAANNEEPTSVAALENGQNLTNHFDLLPDEVLVHIFSYLHAKDVSALSRTNQLLRRVALQQAVVRVNLSRSYGCSWEWINAFLKPRVNKMKTLNLAHNHWLTWDQMDRLVYTMMSVTKLDITGCHVKVETLDKILSKARHLKSLAYTDHHFEFTDDAETHPSTRIKRQYVLSDASRKVLSSLTHLSLHITVCIYNLSLARYCPNLVSLSVDAVANGNELACSCNVFRISRSFFQHLKEVCWTPVVRYRHSVAASFLSGVVATFQKKDPSDLRKCLAPLDQEPVFNSDFDRNVVREEIPVLSPRSVTHLDLRWTRARDMTVDEKAPSLRYLRVCKAQLTADEVITLISRCPNLEFLSLEGFRLKHRHEYEYMYKPTLEEDPILPAILEVLPTKCPHLQGFNLNAAHAHSTEQENPVIRSLGNLKRLQYLCVSQCSLTPCRQKSKFDSKEDQEERRTSAHVEEDQNETQDHVVRTGLAGLVKACPGLLELELLGLQVNVALSSSLQTSFRCYGICTFCEITNQLDDASLVALGNLKHLQRLTLAGISGIRHGRGLATITKQCTNLSYLSLADIGLQGQCTWIQGLCDALNYAHALQDLRVEHRNMVIPARFQDSLQNCKNLRRLCIITLRGRFVEPSLVTVFDSCKFLRLLFVITADTDVARKKIKYDVMRRFNKKRTPFTMVFARPEPLGYTNPYYEALKPIPSIDLQEVVLFDSHVCSAARL